jgi:hypothetical protein
MPDKPEPLFAKRLLRGTPATTETHEEGDKGFTSEPQAAAQAFGLRVRFKDGRRALGFSWAMYAGYEWTDDGSKERLVLLFGMRALTVEGYNLKRLVHEIDEGQLRSMRENSSSEVIKKRDGNPGDEPIITRMEAEPPFEDILNAIKGIER